MNESTDRADLEQSLSSLLNILRNFERLENQYEQTIDKHIHGLKDPTKRMSKKMFVFLLFVGYFAINKFELWADIVLGIVIIVLAVIVFKRGGAGKFFAIVAGLIALVFTGLYLAEAYGFIHGIVRTLWYATSSVVAILFLFIGYNVATSAKTAQIDAHNQQMVDIAG